MTSILSRNWGVLFLRGIFAIVFGAVTWLQPGIALGALVLLFATYALADGTFSVWIAATAGEDRSNRWILLLWGLVGIVSGILTFIVPGLTAVALLFYIAIWAVATGILQIMVAIHLRDEIDREWLLALCGFTTTLFGLLLMTQPTVGALSMLWLIATYALAFGALLVILAFEARAFGHRLESTQPPGTPSAKGATGAAAST